ncbi:hypothetical protein L2E82_29812 [Cichorium intybus]|uniref:Uncharacterized protein n=1 Tax=Cichorium intybus TaxID=13427 RepID=A0ACB9CYY9_CICIN|nr:hypothetical protein L2E82_29812 [Cichorium intybus]
MSSSSFKKFAHLQIPLEEIVSATNKFSDANLIQETGFRDGYRGQLLRSEQLIHIVAHRFNRSMNQTAARRHRLCLTDVGGTIGYSDPAYSTRTGIVYSIVEGTSKRFKGKNLEHLKIPLADIEKATENFAEKYLIGSGTYGTQVYLDPEYDKKGKLKNE